MGLAFARSALSDARDLYCKVQKLKTISPELLEVFPAVEIDLLVLYSTDCNSGILARILVSRYRVIQYLKHILTEESEGNYLYFLQNCQCQN